MGENSECNDGKKLLEMISKSYLVRLRRNSCVAPPALVELYNFDKNRCEIPLFSGALDLDLRFKTISIQIEHQGTKKCRAQEIESR